MIKRDKELIVVGDRVLVRVEEGEERTNVGLYLPPTAVDNQDDYFPPTPLTRDNIFGHALFGIAHAPVDALVVNGRWVIRDRQFVSVDERAVAEKATACARQLWRRF